MSKYSIVVTCLLILAIGGFYFVATNPRKYLPESSIDDKPFLDSIAAIEADKQRLTAKVDSFKEINTFLESLPPQIKIQYAKKHHFIYSTNSPFVLDSIIFSGAGGISKP